MIDWLMGEYHLSRREAFERFPMPAALILMPASIERHGKEPAGPGAEMRAFIAAANAAAG